MENDKKSLNIQVPQPVITSVEKVLRTNGVPPKSTQNLVKLYVLLRTVNGMGLINLPYEDIAEIAYSGHRTRLTKGLKTLVNAGLLRMDKRVSSKTGYKYNTYTTIDASIDEAQVPFVFSLPDTTFEWTQRAYCSSITSSPSTLGNAQQEQIAFPTGQQNVPIDIYAPIYMNSFVFVPIEYDKFQLPTLYLQFKKKDFESRESWVADMIRGKADPMSKPVDFAQIASSVEMDFLQTFKSWYDQLLINGVHAAKGAYITKDGRLYHEFHGLHKVERYTQVLWNGNNLEEVWDAHSAIFAVIGYYIKNVYDGNDKDEMTKEANALIDLTLDNNLYSDVMTYYKQKGTPIDRDKAKVLCNRYRSVGRNRLLRRDGTFTNHKDVQELHIIDSYFEKKFPHIRAFFLDYPRRKKLDRKQDGSNVRSVAVEGMGRIRFIQPKSVSNLQKDIMPYELKLISLGICRELYQKYGIESVTVHDAIYMQKMKEEDKRDIRNKIDDIYRTLLGRVEPATKGKATSKPLWRPEDEEEMNPIV